ncbi:ABC transporter permease [Diaminobutyricimonas sp. LJ205]|uniref:ABC transporter permease n=1 Tax=Diaminobutyricimonas sp. LJ205 TaxID=2683590 RepID=UPI0012F499BF|nr:ABC transporter permease [Diaminobutyricimonas sp. LJ205]
MATFIIRRLIASFFVLLAATYLMYLLTALSGDPLEDLRASTAPNAAQLIERRIDLLHLDVPPYLRYFIWLAGVGQCFIGQCDLGVNVQGQPVITLLSQAFGQTLQLVTIAAIIAIVVGVIVGITTALRQYSGYDYSVTFLAFLFFSLPIFWVAVLLKQYIAIGFNDFLRDPVIPAWLIAGLALLGGIIWMSMLGGNARKRLMVFGIAAVATAGVLVYISVTDWFRQPSIGIVGIGLTAVGAAFGITAVSTGLRNRKALYSSLTVAAIALALYYPLQFVFVGMSLPLFLGLAVATVVVSGLVGWFWGGHDRWQSVRTAIIVGVIIAMVIALDEYMSYWEAYSNSSRVRGRPIATIGSATPNLGGNFWVQGVDTFTHLLLPTIALILVSVAAYTRYTRSSMLEVLNQDYIRTARAKGLTERTVMVRHAFRNALIPIATIIAFDIGALIGGAVITERVFAWTGMGALFQNGLEHVDPNPVMAFFLVTGTLAVVFNLIADLVYAALDPRIRIS